MKMWEFYQSGRTRFKNGQRWRHKTIQDAVGQLAIIQGSVTFASSNYNFNLVIIFGQCQAARRRCSRNSRALRPEVEKDNKERPSKIAKYLKLFVLQSRFGIFTFHLAILNAVRFFVPRKSCRLLSAMRTIRCSRNAASARRTFHCVSYGKIGNMIKHAL